jgi:hypothetical protein
MTMTARDTIDSYSQRGDTVIAHPAAAFYSDGSLHASNRPRPGMPAQVAPEAPREAPLPFVGVARQLAGKEAARLRAQAARGRDEINGRFTFSWNGSQISDPATITMRSRLAAEIDAAEAEADRIDCLDDGAVRAWAASYVR